MLDQGGEGGGQYGGYPGSKGQGDSGSAPATNGPS